VKRLFYFFAIIFFLCVFAFSEENLRSVIDKKGIFMGTCVSLGQLEDPKFVDILTNNYNYITPDNDLKWENVHPGKKVYNFKKIEKFLEFAKKNKMRVRGHTLIWHTQNPYWIAKPGITPEELKKVIKEHITTVVGTLKGKITDWDVINEPIADNGEMRENLWYLIIGEEYIEYALKIAHKADPKAKLFINDYSIETVCPKSDTLYNLVKKLKEKNVPLSGVGFQFHLDGRFEPDYESIRQNFKRFKELGLEIQITEMDVRLPKNYTDEDLKRQARIFEEVLKIFLSFEGNTFVMWGLTDKYSWIPGYFSGFGAAHIFDENFNPKPAYNAIKKVLTE